MRIHGIAAIGGLGIAALGGDAQAAVFTVTKTADTNDGACNADCSLREAVAAANTNPGADEVVVPAGSYVLTLLTLLQVTDDLTLTGALPVGSTLIDQNGILPIVIDPGGGVTAEFVNLHVQNGLNPFGEGGCILNWPSNTLALTNCRVTDCSASTDGGAIANRGTLTISDSVVADSTATGEGGGIWNEGTLTITGTSIEGNQATRGGGIRSVGGMVGLEDAAVLANSTAGGDSGGGIESSGTSLSISDSLFDGNSHNGVRQSFDPDANVALTITASTFRNHALAAVSVEETSAVIVDSTLSENDTGVRIGSGKVTIARSTVSNLQRGLICSINGILLVSDSTITEHGASGIGADAACSVVALTRTIVAGNGLANCQAPSGPAFLSLGHNLDDDGSCNLTAPGDLSNVPDAGLAPLGDYGGPTQTHALLPGSPAIDAGHAFDQRGAPLHDGDGDMMVVPDLGAYELPEPGMAAMLAAGGLLLPGLVWLRRRRRVRAR